MVWNPLCFQTGFQKSGEQKGIHVIDQGQIPPADRHLLKCVVCLQKLLIVTGVRVRL